MNLRFHFSSLENLVKMQSALSAGTPNSNSRFDCSGVVKLFCNFFHFAVLFIGLFPCQFRTIGVRAGVHERKYSSLYIFQCGKVFD